MASPRVFLPRDSRAPVLVVVHEAGSEPLDVHNTLTGAVLTVPPGHFYVVESAGGVGSGFAFRVASVDELARDFIEQHARAFYD